MPIVILNAVKNLILYAGVALFSWDAVTERKMKLWVQRDEILHCVQNDRGHLWVLTRMAQVVFRGRACSDAWVLRGSVYGYYSR